MAAIMKATALLTLACLALAAAPPTPPTPLSVQSTWPEFTLVVPEGFVPVPENELRSNVICAYFTRSLKSGRRTVLVGIEKLGVEIKPSTFDAQEDAAFLQGVAETFKTHTEPDVEPTVELYKDTWQSVPVRGYRIHYETNRRPGYCNGVQIPLKGEGIQVVAMAEVEYERDVDRTIRSVLANLTGPAAPPASAWGGPMEWLGAAALFLGSATLLLLLYMLRRRKRPAGPAQAPPTTST